LTALLRKGTLFEKFCSHRHFPSKLTVKNDRNQHQLLIGRIVSIVNHGSSIAVVISFKNGGRRMLYFDQTTITSTILALI